jgi:citrate synthase
VAESFAEFIEYIGKGEVLNASDLEYTKRMDDLSSRKQALITTTISNDERGEVQVLGEPLLEFVSSRPFASIVGSMFLGKKTISKELEEFVDFTLRLLVEHGPYVSGSVNTIVTARAGRDLVSALATGLLTIGPRFGGAINQAAGNWLSGVDRGIDPADFVEEFASKKEYISGIGHRKYRVDAPDPRVAKLLSFTDSLSEKKFSSFAKGVEKVTVAKKGNLILNVDGAIAAILLDILSEKEGMETQELESLVKTEFFNALFVLSRSVGFISHFLDQKRIDEGLFRLDEEHVTYAKDLFNE